MKRHKKIFLNAILVICFICCSCSPENIAKEEMLQETNVNSWINYYYRAIGEEKSNFHYVGNSLIDTAKNTFITAGYSKDNDSDLYDNIFIQEIDNNGKLVNTDLIELENINSGEQFIFQLSNEELLLIGRGDIKVGDTIKNSITILKININSHSIILAKKIFYQNLDLSDFHVIEDIDKNFVVCGTWNYNTEDADIFLAKISQDGEILWAKTFGGVGFDFPWGLTQSSNGGVLVCGFTESFGRNFGSRGGFILKVNISGELNFLKLYGNPKESNRIEWICSTNYGYLSGGYIGDKFKVLLLDETGDITNAYYYKDNVDFYKIFSIAQNEYIAAGCNKSQAIIGLIDNRANVKWLQSYGNENTIFTGFIIKSAIISRDNYLIAAGWEDFGLKGIKHAVMKISMEENLNSNCIEFVQPLDIPKKSSAGKIKVENANKYQELKQRDINPNNFEVSEIQFKIRNIKDSVVVKKICGE